MYHIALMKGAIIPGTLSAAMSYITYTARGHGESSGWESTGYDDPAQFQWDRLGKDMVGVARYSGTLGHALPCLFEHSHSCHFLTDPLLMECNHILTAIFHLGLTSFITAGSSQGSATALYAAMDVPDAVRAVIMVRPPNAWGRNPEKKLESAEECRQRHPGEN